ncbi:MAG: hypothetical protein LQ349_009106, partial [Xanthoria aureola]
MAGFGNRLDKYGVVYIALNANGLLPQPPGNASTGSLSPSLSRQRQGRWELEPTPNTNGPREVGEDGVPIKGIKMMLLPD